MHKLFLYLFSIFLVLGNATVGSQDMLDYENLVREPALELKNKAETYMRQNHTDTAMGYYLILAGKYSVLMNRSEKYLCAMACFSAGLIYYQKEDYSHAFELYIKGVKICDENGFGDMLAQFYKNIGNIYSVFADYGQAIDSYKKALSYAREFKNIDIEIKTLINLVGIYCYSGNATQAKLYYDEMMRFAERDSMIAYFGYLNKAHILMAEQRNDSAVLYFEKSVDYARRTNMEPKYVASAYGGLADLYERMHLNDSALYYFHANAAYTERNNLLYMLVMNLEALSRLYAEEGFTEKAQYYKRKYLEASDSLFNMNEFNKMKNAQFLHEMDKNYQKIASLTSDNQRKEALIRTRNIILGVVSVSLLVFIVLLVLVYFQKKKLNLAYKDLFARNSELLKSEMDNKRLRIEYENRFVALQGKQEDMKEDMGHTLLYPAEEQKCHSANKLTDAQKRALLDKILHVMEETTEFCNVDFNLEHMAELIGSNSRYVSLVINETYGKNFRTFVNEYRIKEACKRLMNTEEFGNFTIKAISESVGYKSHTNFIEIFKKTTGITPSVYQKMALLDSQNKK